MPRKTLTPDYVAQLEARAQDAKEKLKSQRRKDDARARILLGALALAYVEAHPANGEKMLQAFGLSAPLRETDFRFLCDRLPAMLAAALKKGREDRP